MTRKPKVSRVSRAALLGWWLGSQTSWVLNQILYIYIYMPPTCSAYLVEQFLKGCICKTKKKKKFHASKRKNY